MLGRRLTSKLKFFISDLINGPGNPTIADANKHVGVSADGKTLIYTAAGEANSPVTGPVNYQDNILQRPLLQDYAAESNTVNSSSNVLTFDMETGNSFFTDLAVSGENINSIIIANAPATGNLAGIIWTFDQDSTPRTLTLPGAWIIVGGVAPDPSGVSSKHKWFMQFDDGGTIVYLAFLQDFA